MTVSRNTTSVVVLDCGGGRRAGIFGPAACASAALDSLVMNRSWVRFPQAARSTPGGHTSRGFCVPGASAVTLPVCLPAHSEASADTPLAHFPG